MFEYPSLCQLFKTYNIIFAKAISNRLYCKDDKNRQIIIELCATCMFIAWISDKLLFDKFEVMNNKTIYYKEIIKENK
jgi:hypothetical protein